MHRFLLLFFILIFSNTVAFSEEIFQPVFPFKGFIYRYVISKPSEISNINITKETPRELEFTYNGKKYSAFLYTFGAIYLNREGQNPLLIAFEMKMFNNWLYKQYK